jgi:hypothetical protein
LKVNFTISLVTGLLLTLVLLPAECAVADDMLIQALDNGRINWSAGTAVASGVGTPSISNDAQPPISPSDILKVARQNAQTNLLETIGAIRIDATSRVADRMSRDIAFREGLSTLVQNATITHQEYLSDGTLAIELTMKLSGGFGQFVLPEEIRQVDSIKALTAPSAVSATADRGPYTGLILDATGIGAKPSLVPTIVDESGNTVYGPAFVSREFAVSRGMSGYATTLAAALKDKRIGERPMVVKAIRTHTTGETDLVISNADAARLRSSVAHLNFLKACRVSIMLDPETGSYSGSPTGSKFD